MWLVNVLSTRLSEDGLEFLPRPAPTQLHLYIGRAQGMTLTQNLRHHRRHNNIRSVPLMGSRRYNSEIKRRWRGTTNHSRDGETGEDKVDVLLPGADVIDSIHMEVHTGRL